MSGKWVPICAPHAPAFLAGFLFGSVRGVRLVAPRALYPDDVRRIAAEGNPAAERRLAPLCAICPDTAAFEVEA